MKFAKLTFKILSLHLLKIVFILFGTFHSSFSQYLPELNKYVCYKSIDKIDINGKLDETSWSMAEFSSFFIDIEGSKMPEPLYKTRIKMLWDNKYFYIGAWLEEPHLWATIIERDAVIFHDNDFEVFIDPNKDTHNYIEIEINALSTIWDLILTKPYRDGGKAVTSWDLEGLFSAVNLYGTINDPTDVDSCWTIEIALPWHSMIEFTDNKRKPEDGEQWKINYSRVQWQFEIMNEEYIKRINPATNKPFPEYNWVWSPQGVINMHQPEAWGMVQFSDFEVGTGHVDFLKDPDEDCKWALRKLYYAQKKYYRDNKQYALTATQLEEHLELHLDKSIKILNDDDGYIGILNCDKIDKQWRIRADGLVWSE